MARNGHIASLLVGMLTCLSVVSVHAQSIDELRRKANAAIEAQKQRAEAELENLRERANKACAELLGRPWVLQPVKPGQPAPTRKTPVVPPVSYKPTAAEAPKTDSYPVSKPTASTLPEAPSAIVPEESTAFTVKTVPFQFYGTTYTVRFDPRHLIHLSSTREKAISAAWTAMSKTEYDALASDFNTIRTDLHLCDWASLQLSEQVAMELTGSMTSSESVLLQVWLMTQCGFRLAVLADNAGRLHKLVITDKSLFDYPGYMVGDQVGYLLDGSDFASARVQEAPFTGTVPLRMEITSPGQIGEIAAKGERSQINKAWIDFFAAFPSFCDDGEPLSSFRYYARLSLSEIARSSLYPSLKAKISDKQTSEAVEILLNYIQKEYPYKEDEAVWQHERYFFPEETLYYPFSDCEDRAILFTRLVRDLLGLRTALIFYPGHLASAVDLQNFPGDAVMVEGRRYVICDPTYIGAPAGREMPGLNTDKAVVLPL